MLLHSIGQQGLDELMRKVYEICKSDQEPDTCTSCTRRVVRALTTDADAVMKNPFQTPEMPINATLFESRLQALMGSANG